MDIARHKSKLFIGGYVVSLVLIALMGYGVASQIWGSHTTTKPEKPAAKLDEKYFASDLALYDLPSIDVTLPNNHGQTTHLRLDISLEVSKKDLDRLEGFKPRLTNRIMNYMQGQKLETIKTADALLGLHSQLLREVGITQPVPVHEVVFRQFMLL